SDVGKAEQKLEELKTARGKVVEASNRVAALIAGAAVKVPAKTQELSDKLDELKAALSQKRFADVQNGLLTWFREAARLEASWAQDAAANQTLLDRRQTLL